MKPIEIVILTEEERLVNCKPEMGNVHVDYCNFRCVDGCQGYCDYAKTMADFIKWQKFN
jgi:hypothetical protein